MPYSVDQIEQRLKQAYALVKSPVFYLNSSEESTWKANFSEMITVVDDLLSQSQEQGHRIDFLDKVGVNGKIQDITSLVEWMRSRLPELTSDLPGQLPGNRLNRYFDQGTGYFANGSFFTTDFDDDLAFFIDDQRIYLKHHIGRALQEAERILKATS